MSRKRGVFSAKQKAKITHAASCCGLLMVFLSYIRQLEIGMMCASGDALGVGGLGAGGVVLLIMPH